MVVVASDNYIRPDDPSSWGTSSGGQVWSTLVGTDQPSILSNEGLLTVAGTPGFDTVMQCGVQSLADCSVLIATRITAQNAGPIARIQNNGTYYRLVIEGGTLFLESSVGFSFTILGSPFALTGFSNADFWNMLLTLQGNNLTGTAWKVGDPQPAAQISVTDSTITLAGPFGLTSVGSSNGALNHFNFFQVDDGTTPPAGAAGMIIKKKRPGRILPE